MTITNKIIETEEKTTSQIEQERKALAQEVMERTLPKFPEHEEFLKDLNLLFIKYPLTTEVNTEPSTFLNLKDDSKREE